MTKKVIYYNDGTVPKEEILATTYQMDDFYKELGKGKISGLNTFNLLQHFKAAKMSKGIVLDVCCGRSLMLPLLQRLQEKGDINIKEYVGVDILKKNMTAQHTDTATGEDIPNHDEYYPFKTTFIESNVAVMTKEMKEYIGKVDFVIYTSAIEHLQWEDQQLSLNECYKLMKRGAKLFLSGPRTPENGEIIIGNKKGKNPDPYDVRYSAHLREPKLSEVNEMLNNAGFNDEKELYGIYGDMEDIEDMMKNDTVSSIWANMVSYLPEEYIRSIFFLNYPYRCSEYLVIIKK